jgi:hypothetical protein
VFPHFSKKIYSTASEQQVEEDEAKAKHQQT